METIKNTQHIQQLSLDAFMHELGFYRSLAASCCNSSYYAACSNWSGVNTISYNTARDLHNRDWKYDEVKHQYFPTDYFGLRPDTRSPFNLTPTQYQQSQAQKLVEKVKIQSNKYGILLVQSNVVKFTHDWYYEELLENV